MSRRKAIGAAVGLPTDVICIISLFDQILIFPLRHSFAVVNLDGKLSDNDSLQSPLLENVAQIVTSTYAFAAKLYNGNVVCWGARNYGGRRKLLTNVKQVFSTKYAFAALLHDKTVVAWGDKMYGGSSNELRNVTSVCSTDYAFAALHEDKTVVTWGLRGFGGGTCVQNVNTIFSTTFAFAALLQDNTVVTWGGQGDGGDSSSVKDLRFRTIFSSKISFVGITQAGALVSWPNKGRKIPNIHGDDVITIVTTHDAFAALMKDGSVVTWGEKSIGGKCYFRLRNVKTIASTSGAFAALMNDGSVACWGDVKRGGDSSSVDDQLYEVCNIFGNMSSFVAVTTDHRIVTWGEEFVP